MAVTRITGTKWIKLETVKGAETTNAAGEGQIAAATINTYNLVDDAVNADKLDETGDYSVNSLSATTDVTATGNVSGADVTASGALAGLTAGVGTNGTEFTVDASGNVVIAGDLTVNGDNVIANTTTLDVEDKNITVAKGGTAATANGAGLTVEITDGTNGSLVYDATSASKFAIGDEGSEDDVVTVTVAQELTNKDVKTVDGVIAVDGTDYDELEDALRALATVAGSTALVLEGDELSAEYNAGAKTITFAAATSITAVYCSGLRMKSGDDYTVAGNVVTLAESLLGNFIVEGK
jgi:hypothetical protein